MARKSTSKNSSARNQPNAPELQQILQQSSVQQPPLNPYYPDISSVTPNHQPPPPPYSSQSIRGPVISSAATYHSVPMSQLNSDISYPRVSNHGHTPVIIQQSSSIPYDFRADRYRRKVRSLTNQSMTLVIISVLMSIWAYRMYEDRHCIEAYVVHKPDKDLEMTIGMVRLMHLNLAYAGGFVFFLCLLRSSFGFDGKSFCCYLFLLSMITFAITAYTAYMAWLSFYSPCPGTLENVVTGGFKSILSKVTDSLPSPDKNVFGESNVFAMAKNDPKGLMIFILDLGSFIFYFSIWVSSVTAC